MAAPSKVSLQDLVKSCGIEEVLLDREVTYVHFYEISRCLCEWKLAALKLNISQAEVDAIERENGKAELQRVNFLGVWKQKMSFRATYRVLVEALLSIGRAEDARGVCLGELKWPIHVHRLYCVQGGMKNVSGGGGTDLPYTLVFKHHCNLGATLALKCPNSL